MPRSGRQSLPVIALLLALLGALPGGLQPPSAAAQSGETYYYRQITNIEQSVSGSVGLPVLSADGQVAAFADAPGSDDPATPNRIYRIAADGSGLAEVDSYTPKCYCGAWVDPARMAQPSSRRIRCKSASPPAATEPRFSR
jgi:hypothetical protein